MKGSTEFSTWVALAFAAIAVAICASYSSALYLLIPAALVGAYLGYKLERISRRHIERYLAQKHLR